MFITKDINIMLIINSNLCSMTDLTRNTETFRNE